jgi:hypothetical protein
MRFLGILTHGPTNPPPTQTQRESMGRLIGEGMQAGWLLECEGVHPGAVGVRLHKGPGGQVTLSNVPAAQTHQVLGGYALLSAPTREAALGHARRFLDHIDHGTWDLYQLFEMPEEDG